MKKLLTEEKWYQRWKQYILEQAENTSDINVRASQVNPEYMATLESRLRSALQLTGVSEDDPRFPYVVNYIVHLFMKTNYSGMLNNDISSFEDLRMLGNTTPPKKFSAEEGNWYRDIEDEIGVIHSKINPRLLLIVDNEGTALFSVAKGQKGSRALDHDMNPIDLDLMLSQMPDGVEDGIRYFGFPLGESD